MGLTVKVKRGIESNLPILSLAEFGFTTDSSKLYIGTGSSNILLAKFSDIYDNVYSQLGDTYLPVYDDTLKAFKNSSIYTDGLQTVVTTPLDIIDSATKLSKGTSDSLRITTPSGYGDIGAQNSGWFHFKTVSPGFYFNKLISVDGDINLYQNQTTKLESTTGYIYELGSRVWTANTLHPVTKDNLSANYIPYYNGSDLVDSPIYVSGSNVLIGTTTDNGIDKLQVNGTVSGADATASNQFATLGQITTGTSGLWTRDAVNGYTYLTNSEDKVGINTLSPSQQLHIVGNQLTQGYIYLNTSGRQMTISNRYGANSQGYNIWIGGGGGSSVGDATYTYYGAHNTAVGMYAGQKITTAYRNSLFGYQAGYNLTTSNYNNLFGFYSGFSLTDSNRNDFFGAYAGYNSKTTKYTTLFGFEAAYYPTSLTYSVFSGAYAGMKTTDTSLTTGLGYKSAYYNNGSNNTYLGAYTGHDFNDDTSRQVSINDGTNTLDPSTNQITFPNGHGFTGTFAPLRFTTTSTAPTGWTNNTIYSFKIIDANTLQCYTSFSDVGSGTHTLIPNKIYNNSTAIGYSAQLDASNQVVLGNTSVTQVKTSGAIYSTNTGTNYFAGSLQIDSTYKIRGSTILSGDVNVSIGSLGSTGSVKLQTTTGYLLLSGTDVSSSGDITALGTLRVNNPTANSQNLIIVNGGGARLAELTSDAANNAVFNLRDSSSAIKVYLNSAGDSYFNGGNVAIGYTNASGYRLFVNGESYFTGGKISISGIGRISTTSDTIASVNYYSESGYVTNLGASGVSNDIVIDLNHYVNLRVVPNAAGNFLTLNSGVISQRTAAEVRTDLGIDTVANLDARYVQPTNGAANRIAVFSDSNTIIGYSDFLYTQSTDENIFQSADTSTTYASSITPKSYLGMHLSQGAGSWHGLLGHNMKIKGANSGSYVVSATHSSFGYRGILFEYDSVNTGIRFITYNGSVTAGDSADNYERMRITNDGNVLIGTTDNSTGSKLYVNGTITASGGNSGQWNSAYSHSLITTGNPHQIDFSDLITVPQITYSLTGDATGTATVTLGNAVSITTAVSHATNADNLGNVDPYYYALAQYQYSTDVNNSKRAGLYRFNSDSTNLPASGYWAGVVYGNGDDVTGQMFTHFQTGETYIRAFNTVWSGWRKVWDSVNLTNVSQLNNDVGYLTSYTETDPVFTASPAHGITSTDISNWNTAYGWGDWHHTTLAGYGITDAYTKTDADSRYVNVTGDTMTGALTISTSVSAGDPIMVVDLGDSTFGSTTVYKVGDINQVAAGAYYEIDFVNGKHAFTGDVTITGNATASGELTGFTTSDIRLKTNIEPIINATDFLAQFNPIKFNWNEEAKRLNSAKDNRINYGLPAQDVQKIAPEFVHPIYGDYLSVDYLSFVPVLIKAEQEHEDRIKELEKRVAELENEVAYLKTL